MGIEPHEHAQGSPRQPFVPFHTNYGVDPEQISPADFLHKHARTPPETQKLQVETKSL